jgi:hypothetical protein
VAQLVGKWRKKIFKHRLFCLKETCSEQLDEDKKDKELVKRLEEREMLLES